MARVLLFFLFFLSLAFPASAESASHHTTARLISAVEGVDGLQNLQVGVEVKLDKGWKTYWRTPGEAGLAPVFDWAGSQNLKSATINWPAPHRFTALGLDNFGYDGAVIFPIDITLKDQGRPLTLKLKLDLLVCETLCVPESHRLELTIPARAAKISSDHVLLGAAMKKVPSRTAADIFDVKNIWFDEDDKKSVVFHASIAAASAPAAGADIFVETENSLSIGKPIFNHDPGKKTMHVIAPVHGNEPLSEVRKGAGAAPVTLTFVDGGKSFERTLRITPGATPGERAESIARDIGRMTYDKSTGMNILLIAFIGGLILNLMPCVLPVLSLKILSVLSHGGKDHRVHRWSLFRNFIASAAGILFSFWLMAAILAGLKAAGHSIGWGIQFQQPLFLVFLMAVLTLFAANLWGLFEIPLPRFIARHAAHHEQEPTLAGHFLTGAFATLLATPCTAPFLGTAVGFALAGAAFDIFTVFTFLGLGLATPYILLAVSPRLFKYMPAPGRWMVRLRKILALALVLTAFWLGNVLATVVTQPTLDAGWSSFDEALIKPAVDDGKTVIVDVTADWCLTCKVNKRMVLEQKDVLAAISGENILRLQADWTHRSEEIAAYLRKYGRYGIPFNIVYGPGAPEGIILRELLSKEELMRVLAEAADE